MTTTSSPERWAIWPTGETTGPVPDAVLADRWNGAMWPGGNASELALRLYGIVDEMAGAVARADMETSGDAVRDVLDMDGLERVIGLWILEHVGTVAA
jgi:hypothetical protein